MVHFDPTQLLANSLPFNRKFFDAELLFTACSTTAEAACTLLTGAVGGLCQLSGLAWVLI